MKLLAILVVVAALATGCAGIGQGYVYAPDRLYLSYDTDVFIAVARFDVTAGVRTLPVSPTSLPVAGPVIVDDGVIWVYSKKRKFDQRFQPGEPLPAWSKTYIGDEEAASMGLTFEAEPEPEPAPSEDEPAPAPPP